MARPKSISDERLLGAAEVVIGASGPGFALAQVAERAGVSVGTVAGRFGSKSGLLQELSKTTTRQVVRRMRELGATASDPVTGLRAALISAFGTLDDPATAGNHLGQLGVDIGDPWLRELLGAHFAAVGEQARVLVRKASAALPGAPAPARAARVLISVINGAALDWSLRPKGRFADRLEQDIDAVLRAWHR